MDLPKKCMAFNAVPSAAPFKAPLTGSSSSNPIVANAGIVPTAEDIMTKGSTAGIASAALNNINSSIPLGFGIPSGKNASKTVSVANCRLSFLFSGASQTGLSSPGHTPIPVIADTGSNPVAAVMTNPIKPAFNPLKAKRISGNLSLANATSGAPALIAVSRDF